MKIRAFLFILCPTKSEESLQHPTLKWGLIGDLKCKVEDEATIGASCIFNNHKWTSSDLSSDYSRQDDCGDYSRQFEVDDHSHHDLYLKNIIQGVKVGNKLPKM